MNQISSVGLPKTVDYNDFPPQLPDSVKASFISISPTGVNVTQPIALPATTFTANSGTSMGSSAQQNILFDIPCGTLGTFIDTSATTLSFRVAWTVTNAGGGTTPAVGAFMNLISSAGSFFDILQLNSANVPLETIYNYNLLHHLLLSSTASGSQRFGNLSVGFGCDTNSNSGIDMYLGAISTYYYNFTIPLLSAIGVSASDKLFPSGLVNSLQLQMTTSAIPPFSTYCTTAPVPQPAISYILDNFTLNIKQIDMGDMATKMLMSSLNEGKIFMKSSSYIYSSAQIPANSSGTQQLVLNVRQSSMKSLWLMFGTTGNYATSPNGLYDSYNPTLTYVSLELNSTGQKYPNRPLNPCQRPAETFSMFSQSMGCSSASTYNGIISAESYNAVLPSAPTGSDIRLSVPAAGLRPAFLGDDSGSSLIGKFPNNFYLGFDLEKTTGSVLFNGVNTRSSPPTVSVIVNTAYANPTTVSSWGLVDTILCFDVESKTITVFN